MRLLRCATALLLVGILAVSCAARGSSTQTRSDLPTYTNRKYHFTLSYPSGLTPRSSFKRFYLLGTGWSAGQPGDHGGRAIVSIPVRRIDHGSVATGKPFPLYFDAEVRVGVSPDTGACYATKNTVWRPKPALETYGGAAFHVLTAEDAGMMQYMHIIALRTVHDRLCYSIEQIETGSSYRDNTMKQGLSRSQLTAFFSEAGTIARTFRFTDQKR